MTYLKNRINEEVLVQDENSDLKEYEEINADTTLDVIYGEAVVDDVTEEIEGQEIEEENEEEFDDIECSSEDELKKPEVVSEYKKKVGQTQNSISNYFHKNK